MSGVGSFLEGFAGGYSDAKSRKERKAQRAEDDARRAEDRSDRSADRDLARDQLTYKQNYGGGSEGNGGGNARRSANASGAAPFRTNDPVNEDLPVHARAFLNSVAGGESAGAYNVRYSPKGGQNFEMNGQHPRVYEPGPAGPSSAAGRYQFTWSTWKDVAGADTPFTEKNQDAYAWKLAQRDYRTHTGRDLDAELQANGMTDATMRTLAPTWAAFSNAKSRPRWSATYDDTLTRLSGRSQPPADAAPRTVAPAAQPQQTQQPASGLSFGKDVSGNVSEMFSNAGTFARSIF